MDSEAFNLFDDHGQHLYLTFDERTAFRSAAKAQGERELRTFCHLLTHTGCRVSEALETTPQRLDWHEQTVIFRTLTNSAAAARLLFTELSRYRLTS